MRPSRVARTKAPSDTRCLEQIFVPYQQDMEDEEVEAEQPVRAREVKDSAVLLLV